MPRRKTYRVRSRKPEKRLHMRVRSPRIVGYELLRALKRAGKWSVLLVLAGAAAWGAKSGLRSFFIENEEFRLREIDLDTNGAFNESHFGEVTQIDATASVFSFHLGGLRKTLEEYPCIVKAELSRRLPGTLRVKVEERVPVAWLECRPLGIVGRDPASGLLVDASGVCFPCAAWWDETAQALPVIVVSQAKEGDVTAGKPLRHHEARRALDLIKLAGARLRDEDWSLPVVAVCNEYSLLAATSNGVLATFGMYEHGRQLDDLIALMAHTAREEESMASVNLIPARNIPVTFAREERAGGAGRARFVPQNRLEREIGAMLGRGTAH